MAAATATTAVRCAAPRPGGEDCRSVERCLRLCASERYRGDGTAAAD